AEGLLRPGLAVALPGGGRLLGRSRPFGGRAGGRCSTALRATLLARGMGNSLAAAAARLLAAPGLLVHGGPGAALGLAFIRAPRLVALGDVLGLTLLLVGILRLV